LLIHYDNTSSKKKQARCRKTDSGQWTVDSGQWTVDSGQWTVDSGQWTVDSRQRTVVRGRAQERISRSPYSFGDRASLCRNSYDYTPLPSHFWTKFNGCCYSSCWAQGHQETRVLLEAQGPLGAQTTHRGPGIPGGLETPGGRWTPGGPWTTGGPETPGGLGIPGGSRTPGYAYWPTDP
jgi:hypothetical protein